MTPMLMADAVWLPFAWNEVDVREVAGRSHAARILEYHAATLNVPADVSDETAWCASFACWVLEQSGFRSPRRRRARSFLQWGQELEVPQLGCVVVLSRPPNPQSGHVGFYIGHSRSRVWLLGGNQGNAVSVRPYPLSRVLSYRWPSTKPRVMTNAESDSFTPKGASV